jgi:hypothetical protein
MSGPGMSAPDFHLTETSRVKLAIGPRRGNACPANVKGALVTGKRAGNDNDRYVTNEHTRTPCPPFPRRGYPPFAWPPSTSGLGPHPFKVVTRVRIPLGVCPRAVSSAGRAPALHAGGRRFEPCTAHHHFVGETRRPEAAGGDQPAP